MAKVDTEDFVEKEEIIINGSNAIILKKGSLNSISWRLGDTIFWIRSNIETTELLKIAENIKILK